MIEFLLGSSSVLTLILVIYLLGILPNLWSNTIIHYSSIEDVLIRGLKVGSILITYVIVVLFIRSLGLLLTHCLTN